MSSRQIRAFVINLDRHTQRWDWFSSNARRLDLEVERIAAIDGRLVDLRTGTIAWQDDGLSAGELACLLSHCKAWNVFLEGDDSHCAVFEDDVHLSDDIAAVLRAATVPSEMHLIKLETSFKRTMLSRRPKAAMAARPLTRLLRSHGGSGGYILSRECAARCVELAAVYQRSPDNFLFKQDSKIWKEYVPYQLAPAVCAQDKNLLIERDKVGFGSDLKADRTARDSDRRREKHPPSLALRVRGALEIRERLRLLGMGENPFRSMEIVPFDRAALLNAEER